MSRKFERAFHNDVVARLSQLDAAFLEACACYFGGGTRIVLELGEYRESRDIDFLCADQRGYRKLRETVSRESLGKVARKALPLGREVRTDQYGIRTRIGSGEESLKFEIIREARIPLSGGRVDRLSVACLDATSCFAEKFLANADRGLDKSTLSRDLVDLAFMALHWPPEDAAAGYGIAVEAYGSEVPRKLGTALEGFRGVHRARCIEALAVDDTAMLTRGLRRLRSFVERRS
jgi:hypothetical protein